MHCPDTLTVSLFMSEVSYINRGQTIIIIIIVIIIIIIYYYYYICNSIDNIHKIKMPSEPGLAGPLAVKLCIYLLGLKLRWLRWYKIQILESR